MTKPNPRSLRNFPPHANGAEMLRLAQMHSSAAVTLVAEYTGFQRAFEHLKGKTKFTCTSCRQNAWGKPDLAVTCTPCGIAMRSTDGGAHVA
jgi:hypothetical protein